LRIAIIGAGIAGQASAIALARDGHDVSVLERFAKAQPIGAGLLLQPSGLAALERLELRNAAELWGTPVTELDGRILNGKRVLDLRYPDGQYGLGIHRGSLFTLLHDAMLSSGARLVTGFEVARVECLARPVVISATGEREGPFDLVLDCAGAHDRLRNELGLDVRAAQYPWGALWTTCADRSGAFTGKLRQRYDRARLMIGILPVGRAPNTSDTTSCVAFFWSLRLAEFERERAEGLEKLKSRVLAAWPESAPVVNEIKSFDELSLATYRDVAAKPVVRGRVVVMGDAAHGTSPQLGQGANLALIDAVTLAYCLRRISGTDAALMSYQRLRARHTAFYRYASRALTPAFQSNGIVIPWLRDALLAPVNRIPGGRYLSSTTLAGVRKFPLGIWKPVD
jgi:2-polyprenyl-6-methoxyphenol hydroxylase-like FAD-dependent oxidoreductase